MTIELLQQHIEAVVNYGLDDEVRDAKIQIQEGNVESVDRLLEHHIVGDLLALADFLGWDTQPTSAETPKP